VRYVNRLCRGDKVSHGRFMKQLTSFYARVYARLRDYDSAIDDAIDRRRTSADARGGNTRLHIKGIPISIVSSLQKDSQLASAPAYSIKYRPFPSSCSEMLCFRVGALFAGSSDCRKYSPAIVKVSALFPEWSRADSAN